jgi:hypothetical protein
MKQKEKKRSDAIFLPGNQGNYTYKLFTEVKLEVTNAIALFGMGRRKTTKSQKMREKTTHTQ